MNTAIQYRETDFSALQQDMLEHLVSEHFERAFSVINTFEADPEKALGHTNDLFRSISGHDHLSTLSVYKELVARVRGMEEAGGFLEGVELDSTLCWLIKESTPFNYESVGKIMNMDREQVKESIAKVRMALLEVL